MLTEYHKIETLFNRDPLTKKLIEGSFRNETIEYLKDNIWEFTEKVDGTNIRIYWDGHKVTFYGRSNNAQIPSELTNRLIELFGGETNEELFEQKFGNKEVILFGEGYGAKIQNGRNYKDTQDFILFDVKINDNYQPRKAVNEIAKFFNTESVPIVFEGTIKDGINYVKTEPTSLISSKANMEGLVGRPKVELRDRNKDRVIVKIKVNDFK